MGRKHYPLEFKAKVVDEARETNPTKAARAHGLHHSTVLAWVKAADKKAGVATTAEPEPKPALKAPAPMAWGAQGFEPVKLEVEESEANDSTEAPAGEIQADTDAEEPKPKTEKQEKKKTGKEVLGLKDVDIDTKVLIDPIIGICDRRLTEYGAEAITKEERDALAEAWGPVLKQWLEGPVEPWHVAAVTTIAVLGPRTLVARKNAVAAREKTEPEPRRIEPEVKERKVDPKLHDKLRNPSFGA